MTAGNAIGSRLWGLLLILDSLQAPPEYRCNGHSMGD